MFIVEKKSLTEYFYSVKDGKSKSFPRCHLDSRVHSHALCKILTYLRQLTYAFTSQSTRILKSFDCALSGPFGNLHLDPALSFPDSLCAHNYFDLRFIGLKRYSICQEFITLKRQCQCTILIFSAKLSKNFLNFLVFIFFFSSMQIRQLLLRVRRMQVLISQEHLPDHLSLRLLIHLFLWKLIHPQLFLPSL